MKSIILSTLILFSATAFSQEIKMPDDKRGKYVTGESKQEEMKKVDERERQAQMDRERKDKEKEKEKGSVRARESSSLNPVKEPIVISSVVFCSVREIGTMTGQDGKVIIALDPKTERYAGKLTDDVKKKLQVATEEQSYGSGLEALGVLSSVGWVLVETNIYSTKDQVVREYLLRLDLK